MQDVTEFNQTYAGEQIRRSKHPLRRLIKYFYLNNVLADVIGAAIDLGCGAGQLLMKLPAGSLGLELNPYLVNELTALGMHVQHYDVLKDNCNLSIIKDNQFNTLIISHVMEHFTDAAMVMRRIFSAAEKKAINRIIIIVPGKLGYDSDKTHQTFINSEYIRINQLENVSGYKLAKHSFFPLPSERSGDYFIYQELKLIYDKETAQ
jgi:hypothetical protein